MDTDELETRAALRRVAVQAAALHRLLSTLPPGAAKLITGGDQDAVSQLASRMLWSSTADLHSQGRSEYAKQVVARAAELAAEGMTQLRLVTNSLAISERFWRTIYPPRWWRGMAARSRSHRRRVPRCSSSRQSRLT